MQHIKPTSKGDPLCPLGFHPQVRWPTRCKRCFRDYKEHGNRNKDENRQLKRRIVAVSSPSLTDWNNKNSDDESSSIGKRSWISSSNLSADSHCSVKHYENDNSSSSASSWTSTPNLARLNDTKPNSNGESVCVTLPRRRTTSTRPSSFEDDYRRTSYTVRRRTSSSALAPKSVEDRKADDYSRASKNEISSVQNNKENCDRVKAKSDNETTGVFIEPGAYCAIHDDDSGSANANASPSPISVNEFPSQVRTENFKLELENLKIRCEKAEKERNEMLMRRVAFLDSSVATKTTAAESSKFHEKIINLTETCETLTNEKKGLVSRIRQLEVENKCGRSVTVENEIASLKTRLQAAESLCEELANENGKMKRELRDREDEIQEMRDNFRENEVDEYSSLKKELEQIGKNCRILSFKLRKSERKAEQLEAEKLESERKSKEALQKLQKELDDVNEKIRAHRMEDAVRKKAPMLGNIPKVSSGEKVSRASLTRGGSQEDPAQLLRDLQDSLEREADLREQLRYAEEEAQNLRKKVTRIEEDNESLLLQLKKLATKTKNHRSSPGHLPVIDDNESVEKDEGISDDEDPAELKVLLELNEQETSVLRKKVEELEENCDIFKRKASDLQDKLLSKEFKALEESKSQTLRKVITECKCRTLEAELKDVKSRLLDKENECGRLKAEMKGLNEKNAENSRSVSGDKDHIDVERQLRIVEQETNVLRARIHSLESENEKLSAENKRLSILKLNKKTCSQIKNDSRSKIACLEKRSKMAGIFIWNVKAIDQKTGDDETERLKEKGAPVENTDDEQNTSNTSVIHMPNEDCELKIIQLTTQIETKDTEICDKESKIKELENMLAQLSESNLQPANSSGNTEKRLSKALQEIKILTATLKSLKEEKLAAEQTTQALRAEIVRLNDEMEKMKLNFEVERDAHNRYKEEQVTELKSLKNKLNSVSENRFDQAKKDFDTKVDDFKFKLRNKQKDYLELTAKYEQLEEEHVKLKCQSNLQKEQLQSQIGVAHKELSTVQNELRILRETYNCRQDGWIKEKLRLEERVKDLEARKSTDESHKSESSKLKLALEAKESESEHLRKNNFALADQADRVRKENEELLRKLDDFEKVIEIQRNMVAESTSLDTELRDLKNQLHNEKEGRKVEVAALKLRYENHVSALSDELKDARSQVSRLKDERDDYKSQSQPQPSPQQTHSHSHPPANTTACTATSSRLNDFEQLAKQASSLEQQVRCMEEQLCEARIENLRLKNESMSERSAWDVRLSEMTSKVNRLEEERLLHSGRTKTVGLKTRMELSWQKEREEQIRLLQETSTLARDLRQTLFEVERERDKERLEMKRRIDQMKKNYDEEQEEAKKKLHELQCDLLELRDAHAKLRTTNEKLRREKENYFRQNLRVNTNEIISPKIHRILDTVRSFYEYIRFIVTAVYDFQIYDLAKLSSCSPDRGLPPVPPPKKHVFRDSSFDSKSASRESSLVKEDSPHLLHKLFDLAQQVRESSNHLNRDAARRAFVSKRPASTESDNTMETNKISQQRRGSLYRKCISLEQTSSQYETYEPHIWRVDDDTDASIISSATSFQSTEESYAQKFPRRYDPTFDSRLSGGSTHSEMLSSTLERKKKKGFLGKLKKLTKSSRSMDDGADAPPVNYRNQIEAATGSNGRNSSNIIPYHRDTTAKKDLKTRITGMFKSSDSRGNSTERSQSLHNNDTSDTSEANDDHITSSQTLPRRTIPSYGKISNPKFTEPNQGGATMPRIISSKK
ncbi:hypothetical protein V9T40_007478 [Parthenolecanium corni]|uniref:Uncharacterized protein n=1 Tax=Parthenolecanium corni TaxID=536013 RepID=A0AAN9TLR0_9HEMI